MAQVAWCLDHPRDLAADFRAIYHLSPAEAASLSGPEYLGLAYRLPAYQGVIAHRATEQQSRDQRNVRAPGARLVDSTKSNIQADPMLRDLVDFG